MKAKCTIIFVLFFFICNAQNDSSSKFTWSDTITNEIAPRIHKLIGSTEKKSYFVSLRGYDIITLDESNNVIDVKNYHRTHIIKRIIKFDDDNIYLVSAQKDKGVFNFYYSKFNLSEGTFGKTVLFDKIEEKTNRYDLFNDEDTPINDNYTGYVLSSDRQKVVFIHSVQNPKAKGDLKIRISYFNKNLERTKLNYIDLQRKKTLNKIVSFSLLNNENLIILINQFEPNVLVKFNENKSWVKPIVKIADYWIYTYASGNGTRSNWSQKKSTGSIP
ncbi:MAG: hypothetical protein ACPGVH_03615, partial [Chitinophagales bacterium]